MKKILVVEDDAKIAAALRIRLESVGYQVVSAGDGFSGLKMTMTHRPDLILLDIMMPVGMGFSVAERLKDLGLGDIPIGARCQRNQQRQRGHERELASTGEGHGAKVQLPSGCAAIPARPSATSGKGPAAISSFGDS